mmetsp:Transcript_32910/g.105562  ORF Transcript_32910/g.105562 Transcript_32910/m.105562 type:complete len:133 (-) Transcript_32910:63-461(-)
MVLTLSVVSTCRASGHTSVGQLHLVDLAAAVPPELSRTPAPLAPGPATPRDPRHADASLSALVRIVSELRRAPLGRPPPGAPLSPRHDGSALTRLLRPALSREAHVALVCCIDPSEAHAEEALDVLGFASPA